MYILYAPIARRLLRSIFTSKYIQKVKVALSFSAISKTQSSVIAIEDFLFGAETEGRAKIFTASRFHQIKIG